MKCAIVQHEAVHEEVIPSFIYIFSLLGVKVDVFLNKTIEYRRGDLFSEFDVIDANINYVDLNNKKDWDSLHSLIIKQQYDFIYSNTFQREGIMEWVLSLGKPVIGLVHNVKIFSDSNGQEKIKKFNNEISLFTLANHVSRSLKESFFDFGYQPKIFNATSCIWPRSNNDPYELNDVRTIGIPGGVNFDNRDFVSLVDAVVNNKDRISNLKFIVMGGGRDRVKLQNLCADKGIDSFFRFLDISSESGMVLYEDYVKEINSVTFIDPLTHNDSQYGSTKITSAIPTALGFLKPVYTNENFAFSTGFSCFATRLNRGESLKAYSSISTKSYSDYIDIVSFEKQSQLIKFKLDMVHALNEMRLM